MNNYYGFPQYAPPMMHRQEVVRVNGKAGADMYQLAPSSSALLLDETAPIVWLVQTDGAGYKVSYPYTIAPLEEKVPQPLQDIEARLKRLEDKLNESNTTKTRKPAAAE